MTTYSFDLKLGDSECAMLEAALRLMIDKCEIRLAAGEEAPYGCYFNCANDVLDRLYNNKTRSSGNSFDNAFMNAFIEKHKESGS